jgi:hypothetical protein
MLQDGMAKVFRGETTPGEVLRVTALVQSFTIPIQNIVLLPTSTSYLRT